jgi:hypothetical protein
MVNFQVAILLLIEGSWVSWEIEILLLILYITVPDLFKGVGTTNKKVIIDIATKAMIKIFLLFLMKFLLREIRKRKNIKIKETPKPR